MNRILTVLALAACALPGLFAAAPARAAVTAKKPTPACTRCVTGKAHAAKSAALRLSASCCTGGICCPQCPTCCANGTCSTGACPSGCCRMAACSPGAACCK